MGVILGALGLGVIICIVGVSIFFYKAKKAEQLEQQIKNNTDKQTTEELEEQLQQTNNVLNSMTSDKLLHPTTAKEQTEKADDFNTTGAIIGGALGGITGAYIGSHIKKKDDE